MYLVFAFGFEASGGWNDFMFSSDDDNGVYRNIDFRVDEYGDNKYTIRCREYRFIQIIYVEDGDYELAKDVTDTFMFE